MAINFLSGIDVDNGVLYTDTTNDRVGIGETNPAQKLHVVGNSEITGDIFLGRYIFHNDDNNTWLGFPSADSFVVRTNGSDRFYINSSGNVGIGTNSPGAKLEVEQSNSSTNTVFLSNSFNNKGFRTGHSGYATFAGYQDSNNTASGSAYGSLIGLNTFYNGTNFYSDNQYIDPSSILFKDGNILFHTNNISATGNFTPNERLRITKTGTVGIGTNSPTATLDVDGSGVGAKIHSQQSIGLQVSGGGNSSDIARFQNVSGSTKVTINHQGNVGIGTTGPNGRLTIGSGLSTDNSTMFNVNGQYNDVGFNGGTSGLLTQGVWSFINSATWNQTRFYVQDQNNADSRLTFDFKGNAGNTNILAGTSTGKVGIGTTSPSEKLVVDGSINSTSTSSNFGTGDKRFFADAYSFLNLARFGALSGSSTDPMSLAFYTSSSGSTGGSEKMRITDTGNVGIGTTSPSHELVVQGASSPNIELKNSNYSNGGFVLNRTNYGHQWKWWAESSIMYFGFSTNESSYANKFTIKSNGNVGIGTSNPGAKLDVVSGDIRLGTNATYLRVRDTASAQPRVLGMNASNNFYIGPIDSYAGGSMIYGTSGNMQHHRFYIAGSEKVRITSGGNVGIGTTSPSSKLQVNGDLTVGDDSTVGSFINVIAAGANQDAGIRFGGESNTDSKAAIYTNTSNSDLHFDVTETTRMLIDSATGNVGIGTTSPAAKLEVEGGDALLQLSTASSTGNPYMTFSQAGTRRSFIQHRDSGDNLKIASEYGSISLFTGTAGTEVERVTIHSAGNVGVGTSTPLYLLDAAGTIRCTSLIQTSQSDKKENIGNIDKSKPKAIPFKEYRYKSDIDSTGRKRYGVLAEDIENDYPELVYVDSNGDKAVNYIDLLVKRVAELEKELEDISLTPGPKGDKGDTGAQGPAGANGTNGKDGANGNDHLKNVQSITFNEKTGQLEITIEGYKSPFRFNPAK